MSLDARLRRLATDRQPDPFFGRRLRSEVLNRWVATREGLAPVPERRWIGREMGRLGRACLYASVALGVSAASVLGVSQESVPGQPLYPLKLRIEQLRFDVLPRHLHDDLALNVLAERVGEVRRLADGGSLSDALALAPAIERAYADVEARLEQGDRVQAAMIERRLAVIARSLKTLSSDLRTVMAALMPGLAIDLEPPAADPPVAVPTPGPPGEAVPVEPAAPPAPPAVAPPPDEPDVDDEGDDDDDDRGDDGPDGDDSDDDGGDDEGADDEPDDDDQGDDNGDGDVDEDDGDDD